MLNKRIYKLSILIGLLCATGCERLDFVPEDKFTDTTYWTSIPKAQSALNNAYMYLGDSRSFFYNEALSDNAYNGRGDVIGSASIAAGIFDASLGRFKDEWNSRYTGIKACNSILENIDRIPNPDPTQVARIKAEARVIRAWLHFALTTWYGDIPLLDHDPTLEEASTITRTPHADVVKFILNELDEAIKVLPTKEGYAESERGKITAGAALALKARVLLYEGRWAEVAATTDALMRGEKGNYALFPSYSDLFLPQNEYSSEDILSLQYVPEKRTWDNFIDIAPLSAGARLNNLAPTQELVNSYIMINGKKITDAGSGYDENNPYQNRDPRLTATVVYHGYQWKDDEKGNTRTIYIKPGSDPDKNAFDEYGTGSSKSPTGYYTRKYWDPTHSTGLQSGLNLMLIRYADVLLMNAEAKNELGQFNAGTWDTTIGALRKRAGFTDPAAINYPTVSQAEMREIIRNERRSEFAMEGLRIFDIRRWKIADQVLNGWAHGARFGTPSEDNGYLKVNLRKFDPSKHYLWPIPRDERNINPNLTQNPGY